MKKTLFSGKSKHTKIYTAITIVAICLLLVLNLGLSHLFSQKLLIADLTREELYTLSDKMVEVCHTMLDSGKEIEITFCTDPDYLIENDVYRATYFMALSLQNMFDNVSVKTVNVTLNPTAVSMYKTTSRSTIDPDDVIISYGGKYRIANLLSFWTVGTSNELFGYDGEYKMASIIASLTAIDRPVAYFATGHGETYYNPDPNEPDVVNGKDPSYLALADLLAERGLEIRTWDLTKDAPIPDDCVLLIINNPTEDFIYDETRLDDFSYISPLERIDRYLVKDYGSLIVNKSPDVDLPCLEGFLSEWGIGFSDKYVYDPDNVLYASTDGNAKETLFTGVYDTDEEGIGMAYYSSYASLTSSPKMVFKNTGYMYCTFGNGDAIVEHGNKNGSRIYAPFIWTSDNAYFGSNETDDGNALALAAMSVRTHMDSFTGEKEYSYIFATNSADFFSEEILGTPSYANYNVMATVISNISRTDKYATIELGGETANSSRVGGKQLISTQLSESSTEILSPDLTEIIGTKKGISSGNITAIIIAVMVAPVAVLTLGIVVFIKRKFM